VEKVTPMQLDSSIDANESAFSDLIEGLREALKK